MITEYDALVLVCGSGKIAYNGIQYLYATKNIGTKAAGTPLALCNFCEVYALSEQGYHRYEPCTEPMRWEILDEWPTDFNFRDRNQFPFSGYLADEYKYKGWDGYSANPIPESLVSAAISVWKQLNPIWHRISISTSATPTFIFELDGGIEIVVSAYIVEVWGADNITHMDIGNLGHPKLGKLILNFIELIENA